MLMQWIPVLPDDVVQVQHGGGHVEVDGVGGLDIQAQLPAEAKSQML
jgi:hypothetical protein